MKECVCVHDQETHACVCCRGETGETHIVELKNDDDDDDDVPWYV